MADETIREFLVGLGFHVDGPGLNRFTQAIEGATLRAKLLGDAIEAMASRIAQAVVKTAEGFEALYYQTQRVGASAASIKALEYAVSQLGGSVGGADRALEGFAQKMRMNPKGFQEYLRNAFGVEPIDPKTGAVRDSGELLIEAARAVGRKFPGNRGAAVGLASDYLGIPDLETLTALQRPGLEDRYKQGLGINKSAGIDEKSVSSATKFEQAFRETYERITKYLEGAEARLFDALKGPLESLNKWLDTNQGKINEALNKIADAIARVLTEWTEDAKKINWPNAADDLIHFSQAVADFIINLKDLVRYMVELNEKSKDWWIIRLMNGAAYTGPGSGGGESGGSGAAGASGGGPDASGSSGGGWLWNGAKKVWNWATGGGASGPDTAGDKTTEWRGLKLKSGETVAGGAVDEGLLALAKHIQGNDPQFETFSSLNDKYHHNLRYHSKHTDGLAFDAVMKDRDYEAARGRTRTYLNSLGLKEGQDYWVEPGTGDHLHVQFQSHRAAQAYAAAARVNANTTAAVGRRAMASVGKPSSDWSTAPGVWKGIDAALPVGAAGVSASGNRTVNATVTNNVNVRAPETNAGSAVGANEDRTRADIARNLQPAVQ